MSPFWAISIILCIIIILFVILPSLYTSRQTPVVTRKVSPEESVMRGTATEYGAYGTDEGARVGSPSRTALTNIDRQAAAQAQGSEEERCMDRDMLKTYYPPPLKAEVPVDYPRKAIGSCPVSKPPSKSLPMTDVPMCML